MTVYGVVKERKKGTLIAGLCIAAIALVRGTMGLLSGGGGGVEVIIGLLILVLIAYKSSVEVTSAGVDEIANIVGVKKHNLWKWEEIRFINADFRVQAPYVLFTFFRENKSKKVRIEKKYVQKIFNWAKEVNPEIKIVHDSDNEYENAMTEAEYHAARMGKETAEAKPKTLHEVAQYIKQQRREELLRKPDMNTVKVKKQTKKLKGWNQDTQEMKREKKIREKREKKKNK